jgi:hypothetical protein
MLKIKSELSKLYDTMEKSKSELSFKKGQLEMKMKELKEVCDVESIREAKKEVMSWKEQQQKLKTKIQKKYDDLTKELSW